MKKLLAIAGTDFLTTYAGTKHLFEELSKDYSLDVYLKTVPSNVLSYHTLPFRCHCWSWWNPYWPLWKRLLSHILFRLWIILKMFGAKRILITEGYYLREAAWVKQLSPFSKYLIQFSQELQLLRDYPHSKLAKIYEKYARVPDLVIDVEPSRAKIRQEYYRLSHHPLVLHNTVFLSELQTKAQAGSLAKAAQTTLPTTVPIVLYAGGIGTEKPFSRIINAVQTCKIPCFLLAFCSAPDHLLTEARQLAQENLPQGSYSICGKLARSVLLSCMWEADIGIVDYSYAVEPTSNQRYCAPTKLYEYLAAGLAIVGSENDSIREIVETCHCGICARDGSDDELGFALRNAISDWPTLRNMKENARKAFKEKYSYEKICIPEIVRLKKILNSWKS